MQHGDFIDGTIDHTGFHANDERNAIARLINELGNISWWQAVECQHIRFEIFFVSGPVNIIHLCRDGAATVCGRP